MKERLSELVVCGLGQGGILPLGILAKIYNIDRENFDNFLK
jgi:hypothetical protein